MRNILNMNPTGAKLATLSALLALCAAGCSGGSQTAQPGSPDAPQLQQQLEDQLQLEFQRLGIDPARVAAQAPQGESGAVFDLRAEQTATSDSGSTVLLSWTEKLAGDYDQNGEVNAADLSALATQFGAAVDYHPADLAYGSAAWPQGFWWDTGSEDVQATPLPGSGAHNWRMARRDGDGNGELNLGDVTPIALNWKATLSAYCIYSRQPGSGDFELIANPFDPQLPFTVWRSAAWIPGGTAVDPLRPVRFYFEMTDVPDGSYEYQVVPYDEGSGTHGDAGNLAALAAGGPVVLLDGNQEPAELNLAAPAVWRFDASGSTAAAAISSHEWDMDGDGEFEISTGTDPQYEHEFPASGSWRVFVRLTDSAGLANSASRIVHVRDAAELRPAAFQVAMSDGIRLSTHLYLPDGSGPWPVMLVRTPYGKDPAIYEPLATEMNNAGYALVTQDVRGRYESEGELGIPLEGEDMLEPRDGIDTFNWLNQQAWCNGSIGTTGGSMLGMTQLYSAPHHPQGLRAQFIGVAPASMYHEFVYVGGAFRQMQMEQWVEIAEFDPQSLEIWRAHPEYDEYWEQFNIANTAAEVQVPGMHYGGWFDTFSQGTIDSWSIRQKQGGEGARDRQWLVMGPWGHGTEYNRQQGELEFPQNAIQPPDFPYPMFMDHFVLGSDTGILERPAVTYYRMGAIGEEGAPGNDWQSAADWPVPHSLVSYYLHADGRLSTDPPVAADSLGWENDPADPTPTLGGRNLYEPKGIFDQRSLEGRADNLLFTTDVLGQPLEVTGRVLANLFVASDAVDTDVAVRLTDVYPDGRSMLILDGILRLRYRDGFTESVLLVPGTSYAVDVDMWSTSHVFNTGHRIRLAVTSSNHARWDLNPGTGAVWADGVEYLVQNNTLYFGPGQASALLLPVVD